MIHIQCFAHLREQTGQDTITLDQTSLSVAELLAELSARYAIETESLMVAINEEYAAPEDRVSEKDRVALIPPVSGG
ncbi:molybdopterin converting factor subunit 1 [Jeotgalibacillus sp. ET6]|uniref:molybdopterin converting factor subunit 1 n=1 Tax=Jeotgalibacillus sp. ET6 TaxID=3037260 RepID=UPI002418A29D|nr:molybdopterin converting factor subunit 1 [Jeotgalibacillus sp. ET6]MDG5471886.1 molybdopterin converting factor subunit 1 [Jeotgalibacillus sp. ET6]